MDKTPAKKTADTKTAKKADAKPAKKAAVKKAKAPRAESPLKAAYKTLLAELKTLTDGKKAAKKKLMAALTAAYDEYRKYVKDTYKTARKAAIAKFEAVKEAEKKARADKKAAAAKAKAERDAKKPATKKVVRKPLTKEEADAVIDRGEKAIAKYKKAAAKKTDTKAKADA